MSALSTPGRRIALMLLLGVALAAAIRMTDRTGGEQGGGVLPAERPSSRAAGTASLPGPRTPYATDFRDPFVWPADPVPVETAAADTAVGRSPPGDTLRPPALQLRGVIDGTAFVQPPKGELLMIAAGERHAGVRVVRVRPDHVVAEFDGRTITLALDTTATPLSTRSGSSAVDE